MHGIEALVGARARFRFCRDKPGRLARGLARNLFQPSRRLVDALDQLEQLAFDAAHPGKLHLGPANLLGHLGKLVLDMFEIFEFRGLFEGLAELFSDLVQPCVQGFDRFRRDHRADRMLEPVRHVDETLVEVGTLIRKGIDDRRGGISGLCRRKAEIGGKRGIGCLLRSKGRGGGLMAHAGREAGSAGRVVQAAGQGLAEALEIVEGAGGILFEPPAKLAHLDMQPVKGRSVFRRTGGARGVGGVRELVEPRMELVEGFAVAALALFDPFHEPPQKGFDRLLVHRALRQGRFAVPAGAGLPTCFRSHPVPHGEQRRPNTTPIGRGTGPRRHAAKRWRTKVASLSKFCVKPRSIVGRQRRWGVGVTGPAAGRGGGLVNRACGRDDAASRGNQTDGALMNAVALMGRYSSHG